MPLENQFLIAVLAYAGLLTLYYLVNWVKSKMVRRYFYCAEYYKVEGIEKKFIGKQSGFLIYSHKQYFVKLSLDTIREDLMTSFQKRNFIQPDDIVIISFNKIK